MVRTKKFISGILMGLLCCLCFLFVGCFDKEIEGTYKFKSMTWTEGNIEMEIKAGEKVNGMIISKDYMMVTLNKDGSVVFVSSSTASETAETETGTWVKAEKGKIAITFDGETQLCECDGKKLVFEEDGAKVILKK